MTSEATLLELVALVYEAAGDDHLWPRFLGRLGEVLGTMTNNLIVQELPITSESYKAALGMTGMAPEYYRMYLAYYHARNPYVVFGAPKLAEGTVHYADSLFPRDAALRNEFYNDWVVPQGMDDALYGVIISRPDMTSLINVVRAKGAPAFTDDDGDVLQALLPHLQRAVELHLRVSRLQSRMEATTEVLDLLPTGILLLDGRGRLVFANKPAQAILDSSDGLYVTPSGLRAATASATAMLRKLVGDAVAMSEIQVVGARGAISIIRPSGKRPLSVLVSPVRSGSLRPDPQIAAVVLITDPDAAEETSEAALARLYGLSPAEAKLAAVVAQGVGLPDACERLHVSRNTVKTHLKHVFEKTGTRRQSELVRLVIRTAAATVQR